MFQKPELFFTKIRDVKSPERGHADDSAIDFFIPYDFHTTTVYPQESVLIPSGIKCVIPKSHCLLAVNKSGVCTKTGLLVGASLIDENYRGEIHIHLINSSSVPVTLSRGQKIIQFILTPVLLENPQEISPEEYEEKYGETSRGSGGFGSTGLF
jgi:dUTP pyrophosphatase